MEKEGNSLFQVNLKGMIALLSEHIYSNLNTFVYELLQSYIDVITTLRNIDEDYKGHIDIFLNKGKTVVFRDDGIGLKEEEVYHFLTTIGESLRRDTPDADDFIGRFGIGLLSCFVMINETTVESHSAMGGQPVCWCGKADGTYLLTLSDEEWPTGSQAELHPKGDWMRPFEYETFKETLIGHGGVLPHPICLHYQGEEELVDTSLSVWLGSKATHKELLDYGAKVFQSSALNVFRIYIESGKVEGVLYVPPFRIQFSARNSYKVYLKRMLLSEDDCNPLSPWTLFIRCLVNADGLLSTASRESSVNNDQLKDARKEVGVAIEDYLRGLAQNDCTMSSRTLDAHHFHIKVVTSEDNELFRLFMGYLPFETNKGLRSFGSIHSVSNMICYTKNLEDLRQVQRIAGAQGWLIVDAVYTLGEILSKKYVRLNPGPTLDGISSSRLLEQFGEVETNQEFQVFEVRANELLKRFGCIYRLKHFTPVDVPVIFMVEEKGNVARSANNPLAAVPGAVNTTKQIPSTLASDTDNEMVQALLQMQGDNKLLQHVVHILYVQSLLQGEYPVNSGEMELFSHPLSELMASRMNDSINFLN